VQNSLAYDHLVDKRRRVSQVESDKKFFAAILLSAFPSLYNITLLYLIEHNIKFGFPSA
jgi:hypothetical protein